MIMPIRIALGAVEPWEVALALALSLAIIPLLVWFAGRDLLQRGAALGRPGAPTRRPEGELTAMADPADAAVPTGDALTVDEAARAFSESLTFAVEPVPGLSITTLPNLRDLGGWTTKDGRSVRRGVLYRSVAPDRLDEAGMAAFAQLGIRTVFDLRTAGERSASPDRVPDGTAVVLLDVLADEVTSVPAHLTELFSNPATINERLGDGRAEALFAAAYRSFVTLPSAQASLPPHVQPDRPTGVSPCAVPLHHRQGPHRMGRRGTADLARGLGAGRDGRLPADQRAAPPHPAAGVRPVRGGGRRHRDPAKRSSACGRPTWPPPSTRCTPASARLSPTSATGWGSQSTCSRLCAQRCWTEETQLRSCATYGEIVHGCGGFPPVS